MSDTNELVERLRPLDLSNLLQHAFRSGFEIAGGSADAFSQWWPEYDPEKCAAYPRVLAALAPVEEVPVVKPTHQADALEIAQRWAIWIADNIEGEDDEYGSLRSSFERDKATLFAALASPPAQAGTVTEAMVEAAAQKLQPQDWDSMEPWEQAVAQSRAEAALTAALGAQTPPEGAVTEAQGWRPIETAPKDGRIYLLLGNDQGVWVGHYVERYQSGYRPPDPWHSLLLNHWHMPRHASVKPTHWMPLPTPPVNQSEGAGK